MTTIQAKVDRLTKIAEEVIAVALITENKELLPGYASGALVDLFSPTGVKRSYSLTESSLNTTVRQYVIAVGLLPTSRGGSEV